MADDIQKAIAAKLAAHDAQQKAIEAKLAYHDSVVGPQLKSALPPLDADAKAQQALGMFGKQGMTEAASDMAKFGPIGGIVAAGRQILQHPKAAYDVANYPAAKSAEGLAQIAGALPDADTKFIQKGIQHLPDKAKFAADMVANAPKAAAEEFGKASAESISPIGIAAAGLPVLDAAKRASPSIERSVARGGQIASGVQAKDLMRIIKDPGVLFRAKSKEAAGKAIGAAYDAAGLTGDYTAEEAISEGKIARDAALKATKALEGGKVENLSDQQVLDGVKGWQYLIDSTPDKKAPLARARIKFKEGLIGELSRRQPRVAGARSDYADASLAEKVKKLVPVNKNGDPSYMRSALGSIGTGLAGLASLPIAAGGAVLQAPITQGLIASGTGAGINLAKPVLKRGLFSLATNAALGKARNRAK